MLAVVSIMCDAVTHKMLLLLLLLLLQGIGYYKPLTQFSKGEYTGANQVRECSS
jgi:hypothetical protein